MASSSLSSIASTISNDCETITTDPALLRHFKGHRDTITSIAFHPTTTKIASTSIDHSLHLWDFDQTIRCLKFTAHQDSVNCVSWSPMGDLLVTSSSDRTIRVWVPTIRGTSSEFRAHTSAVQSIDFHPKSNNKIISSSNDKTIKLWKITHRNFLASFTGHTNWVRCAKFSPNGKMIASCSDDRTIRIFDLLNTNEQIHKIMVDDKSFGQQILWHPDGNMIACGMNNGRCKIYDIRTQKLIQYYCIHSNSINSIAIHPSGNYLLTGSLDGTMKILDLFEGRPIYTIGGHSNGITSVAFSKDGHQFASGGDDKQLMIWKFNINPLNIKRTTNNIDVKNVSDEQIQINDNSNIENNSTTNNKIINPRLSDSYKKSEEIFEDTQIINSDFENSSAASINLFNNSLKRNIGKQQSKLKRRRLPSNNHRKLIEENINLSKRLDLLFNQMESLRALFETIEIRIEKLENVYSKHL